MIENYDIAFSRMPSPQQLGHDPALMPAPNQNQTPKSIGENTNNTASTDANNHDILGEEVVLLVVERTDLPKMSHPPQHAVLTQTVLGQHSIQVTFAAPAPIANASVSGTANIAPAVSVVVECLNVPLEVFEALQSFDSLWFCTVDKEEEVSEHNIPLRKAS